MTCKTILRTGLTAFVALILVAAPAAAAPDRQDAERATWMVDLRGLLESFYGVLVSEGKAVAKAGDKEAAPPPPAKESESCDDCSDTSPDLDPDG